MRKQAKKTRKKTSKTAEKKVQNESSEISFKAFFDMCVRKGKLRPEQDREIEAFFKDMKLKSKEDLDTYRKMLEKY